MLNKNWNRVVAMLALHITRHLIVITGVVFIFVAMINDSSLLLLLGSGALFFLNIAAGLAAYKYCERTKTLTNKRTGEQK